MMRKGKYILLTICLLCIATSSFAQDGADTLSIKAPTEYPIEYLDTVNIKKVFKLNNYSMIGFEYGASMGIGRFSPSYNHKMTIQPIYTGVTFTHYQKNYNGSPNYGYEVGVFYGKQGYCLDSKSGILIEHANQVVVDYIQVPLWMVVHFDAPHIKAMVNLGPYGGYRLGITRTNTFDPDAEVLYPNSFGPHDSRFDFGLNGGAGFGIAVDPVELHFYLRTSFSFSSFFDPEAYITETSKNMIYIYPWDVSLTVALQFQISRRSGKTNSDLRNEARERVISAAKEKTEQ